MSDPMTLLDIRMAAGDVGATIEWLLEEAEAPSWLPVSSTGHQGLSHNSYTAITEVPTVEGRDSLERVMEDLNQLPRLKPWLYKPLLYGGWHEYAQMPATHEQVHVSDGVNPNGETIWRKRWVSTENKVRVTEASKSQTLAIIRAMREAGWTPEQAWAILNRWPVVGARWLFAEHNPERQFWTCWEKAAVPKSELGKRRLQRKKFGAESGFVSIQPDRDHVYQFIKDNPGLGTRAITRDCGLPGNHVKGRVQLALQVMRHQGRIRTEPGPRNAVLHFVVEVQILEMKDRTAEYYQDSVVTSLLAGEVENLKSKRKQVVLEDPAITALLA